MVYDDDRDLGPGAWDLIGLGGVLVTSLAIGLAVGLVADSHAETSPTFTMLFPAMGMALARWAS
ncbi:AtpZ/AtpI family protein [Leekyejoonella antrihumi]|uniref:Uncharacterized protein n=1 Tax=Leekyejoonella antrihumi TaxID=1660198 RepID=A0A563E2I7_9MICO|nr:AtpZ/AtpI family protein [Leekyejoonella antrihumi]TWP36509.1 hypothetical protein FGL98_09855 [Leekyejoonella antrihumi]